MSNGEVKVLPSEWARWYTRDGKAVYDVPLKSRPGETRPADLSDARKLNLVPSVTTVLKIKANEALMRWRLREVAIALETSPRIPGEGADRRIDRILNQDREQDETARRSADLGTQIHRCIELCLLGKPFMDEIKPFVEPVVAEVRKIGEPELAEHVVIGNGYAGKVDLVVKLPGGERTIIDFKTTKSMPSGRPRSDHEIQLGAYGGALYSGKTNIRTCNIYVSTLHPNDLAVFHYPDWRMGYEMFQHLLAVWRFEHNYYP